MSELLDNRAHRVRTLKDVIRQLHEGQPPTAVKARLLALVRECDASEIASMEQELLAEGMPVKELMGLCDLHSRVLREILVERVSAAPPPGHPVDTFRRENEALGEHARALRAAIAALIPDGAYDEAAVEAAALLDCRRLFAGLMDVEKHYQRKEHLLFSCLERHGITGPSTVMWGKDDEVRKLLDALGAALAETEVTVGDWRVVRETVAEPALAAVDEMIFKEERILLPMALQNLTETEWGEIFAQSPQFGYCLVDPREGYEPPSARSDVPAAAIVFPTGALSLAQLKALFAALPVDVTFVDADDRVRFFSEGPRRVFVRPKAVLGRLVQRCHPPSSVGVVERILDDFRAGRRSVAEFWIELRGRFVHIRYFRVQDEQGSYLGTLEVTQDLTRERGLAGERRLLEYEA